MSFCVLVQCVVTVLKKDRGKSEKNNNNNNMEKDMGSLTRGVWTFYILIFLHRKPLTSAYLCIPVIRILHIVDLFYIYIINQICEAALYLFSCKLDVLLIAN